ncbi:MAG: hypothetical protein GY714_25320 [Desulfobacterales bacterium]|nr:hypothetical protein [Desulfobacterales bacterium]
MGFEEVGTIGDYLAYLLLVRSDVGELVSEGFPLFVHTVYGPFDLGRSGAVVMVVLVMDLDKSVVGWRRRVWRGVRVDGVREVSHACVVFLVKGERVFPA